MSGVTGLIAVEEHFMTPALAQAAGRYLASAAAVGSGWREAGAALSDAQRERTEREALDLGDGRISAMDAAGVELAVLSVSTVANLQMLEAAEGTALAREANDELAQAVRDHPGRFAGLACLAPQDPDAAAAELERAVSQLGLVGVVINSHVRGEYLDAPRFAGLFEAVEALGVPIYLHPSLLPAGAGEPYLDYGLMAALWGYAAEASLHALRIILAGTFDRFPGVRLVLGHLGEHIPFSLPRIDAHHRQTKAQTAPSLRRLPSDYVREHIWVSTSGMNHAPRSIRFCLDELGPSRVMFAADHPFEEMADETAAFAAAPLSDAERAAVAGENARAVFGL
jgi:predicted TIM-barrel fold metal-dependent hydrolase